MRKIIIKLSFSVICVFIFTLSSCKHEPNQPAIILTNLTDTITTLPSNEICFQDKILPIIQTNCAKSGCHDPITAQENMILTNYNNIRAVVSPGSPSNSKIYKVLIASQGSESFMPPIPDSPLTPEQKALIYDWIVQGAKNTNCLSSCDSNIFTFSSAVMPTIQQKCVGCHSGATPNGNLNLQNYNQIINAVNLYARITSVSKPMPPTGLMDACKIRQIKKWIDAGKLNN